MQKLLLGNRWPVLRLAFPLIMAAAMCLAFLPLARAVTPAPDGGYSGNNTAEGTDALFSRTTGAWNTAVGFQALHDDTTGNTSVAVGFKALHSNNADYNTAVGSQALLNDTTGEGNIALGGNAGINITEGDDNINIGHPGSAGDDGIIHLGRQGVQAKTYIGGISGVPVVGTTVAVSSSGQLGVAEISSARFKEKIQPMEKASEAILALKPVSFRYKKELDPEGATRFGLVAEEVAKVNPDLVTRDRDGKPYTVRYEAINAMLLNEFLKEHYTVQELTSALAKHEARIALQDQQIKSLTAALREQATQIQKVSAQLETSKPAPQLVVNH